MKTNLSIVSFIILLTYNITSFAKTNPSHDYPATKNVVQQRLKKEEKLSANSFSITFHAPNYILPYYYTASPYNSAYTGNTPGDESLKKSEIKYQFSFKVPVWRRMFNLPSTLYIAYTQMSYWQAYDKRAFFRETDYAPEVFISNDINFLLLRQLRFNLLNIGLIHQSNGFGNALERSWNRFYIGAVASTDHWAVSIKPWYIFHDSTYERQNRNMAKYMGYGSIGVAYKHINQVFSIEARNVIESHGKRPGVTLAWSFPITPFIKGYIQGFTGFGQSLIEYNHRTNSIGLGIGLSDWI